MFAAMPGKDSAMILGRVALKMLGICSDYEFDRIACDQYGESSGVHVWRTTRQMSSIISPAEVLEPVAGLERKVHQNVGTQDIEGSRDEQLAGQRGPAGEKRWGCTDSDGQGESMPKGGKIAKEELYRGGSLMEVEHRGQE